ncbi:MAG TPA: hypothetical protein VI056_14030 [Candidatus Limnocylindria bacterium]
MPLFGKFFSDDAARAALRSSLIPLEMPRVPGHRLHALAGRSVLLTMREQSGAIRQTVLVFDTFAELCDRYRDVHRMPFLPRTDGKGGTQAPDLETAARQYGLQAHYRYGSTIGIDAALLEGLSRHPRFLALAGEPGSERWDAVILTVTLGAQRLINSGATSYQTLYRMQTGAMTMFTKDLDSPLFKWIEQDSGRLSELAPAGPRACECGCIAQ